MSTNRRSFLKASALLPFGTLAVGPLHAANTAMYSGQTEPINPNVFGPREGYTPMVSNLVSMMGWMRTTLLSSLQGLTVEELDHHQDKNANSIGAMLLHLTATERFYQLNSFHGHAWGNFPAADKDKYDVAMSLGKPARKKIIGNPLSYYLDELATVRRNTLEELKTRDDKWLLAADNDFVWGPTNNYCKWFHVVEHESNHNGQIKFLKKRIS
ncbi:MAG: DinB family protein [Saprospiraceae bacterium]